MFVTFIGEPLYCVRGNMLLRYFLIIVWFCRCSEDSRIIVSLLITVFASIERALFSMIFFHDKYFEFLGKMLNYIILGV